MTKEEQKELLNVAHHLRQAFTSLEQARVAATKAARVGGRGSSAVIFCSYINSIHEEVGSLEGKVVQAIGPVEKHPGFPCDKVDCHVHGKDRI
jgi:hypothetical protein